MIELHVTKLLLGSDGPFDLEIALKIRPGELLTLFGKSGSGKTTLLRMLSGLETPATGFITVNGVRWFDSAQRINLSPQQRRVGMVFQDYTLFPNMTVRENLRYAQPRRDDGKIDELLAIAELGELQCRYPSTLSGGQQQRAALARAIIREPELLLLDEPLSALDTVTRMRLQDEIARIHRHFRLTTILVSHDKQEVFRLSDRVAVMERGRVSRCGEVKDIFLDRATSNKFSFVGVILNIKPVDVIHIATIGVGDELVEVVLSDRDLEELKAGDTVLVASKAFNPIVKKLS